MPLDSKQVEFIQARVRKLGSVERVRRAYDRDDLVSRYAVAWARELFDGDGGIEYEGAKEETEA